MLTAWAIVTHQEPTRVERTIVVSRIIDGDTVVASSVDGEHLGRVRLVGIDAPELDSQDCGADAARTALDQRAPPGTTLALIPDPTQPERDRYGRLLGYLDHAGNDVGLQLLADGHVRTWGDHPRSAPYEVAEADASQLGLGIWGQCG